MTPGSGAKRAAAAALTLIGAGVIALLGLGASQGGAAAVAVEALSRATIGEARRGALTVALPRTVTGVTVTEARVPGRPIVVIDPGHGGRDPGAVSVSGSAMEKSLTLELARELRDHLAERGRVRVALTRDEDSYLTLDERAGIARQLGAAAFISLHMDSAPNPLARGASVYSLSDVASDAEAARFAHKENKGVLSGKSPATVQAMLADLALRDQMGASAQLAERLVRLSKSRVALRPEPHKFADFHVLRRAGTAAVLFEAGYISNADDELMLTDAEQRAAIVQALARAIEADVASRTTR